MKKNIEFKRFVNKKTDPEELKIVKSISKKFFIYRELNMSSAIFFDLP